MQLQFSKVIVARTRGRLAEKEQGYGSRRQALLDKAFSSSGIGHDCRATSICCWTAQPECSSSYVARHAFLEVVVMNEYINFRKEVSATAQSLSTLPRTTTFIVIGRRLVQGLVVILGLTVVFETTLAAPLSPAVKEQCGAEIRSKCLRPWRLTPDAISTCVEENKSSLSPVCQAFWVTAHMCQVEMRQVCNGLNPLTIKSCFRNSAQEFSSTCRETLGIR
jgi:hypothetical protein